MYVHVAILHGHFAYLNLVRIELTTYTFAQQPVICLTPEIISIALYLKVYRV
jgi:hypothetical protein